MDSHLQAAIAFHRAGRVADAMKICSSILASRPNNFDATYLMATLYAQQGTISAAVEMFRRAVRLKPDFFDAHYNLAFALNLSEDHKGALRHYQRALRLKPEHPDAITDYAGTLSKLGRFQDAVQVYRNFSALWPDDARGHYNLSTLLTHLGQFEEAAESAGRATAVHPGYAEAHFSHSLALKAMERLEEALSSCDKAIAVKPDYAEAFNTRGVLLYELGRFDAALENYNTAIALDPDSPDAYRNRSMLLLLLGNFDQGWSEMEWRVKRNVDAESLRDKPLWLGNFDIAKKTLLVHWEQGLGDTIQFCRFVSMLDASRAKVLFMPQRSLGALMSSLKAEMELVEEGRPLPEFDCHCPLMSLPLAFKTMFDSIPAKSPYLFAERDRVERWRRIIGESGFKIGIAWQSYATGNQFGKSAPLARFACLSKVPGVRLISLQKNEGSEQLDALPVGMAVETLGDTFDSGRDAFLDTAAVMKNLDLVITIDTSIAHLAGALGVPTWVALKQVPEWRWLMDRPDSPWYPAMRLFRQKRRGDWEGVFDAIEAALLEQIARNSGSK